MTQIPNILAWVLLASALALMPALPEWSSSIALAVMILSIAVLALDIRGGARLSLGQGITVTGAALLALALVPTTRSPSNYFVFLAVLPVALAVPTSFLLGRLADALSLYRVAGLALVGTGLAAAITGYDVFVRGMERGGYLTMNPIHIADISVLLGFMALAGALEDHRKRAAFFLLGPPLALLATAWSGSRGPLMAIVVLSAISAVYLWRARFSKFPKAALMIVALVGLCAAVMVPTRGVDQLAGIAAGMATESSAEVDDSTSIRLSLYEGGLRAFLASPLYGQGGDNFVAAADAGVSADISGWDHLHSDLADFAAIGGLLGLLCYACFLIGPIIAAWQTASGRPVRVYIALISACGVGAMGLTNAMIGILSVTLVYATITAVVPRMKI